MQRNLLTIGLVVAILLLLVGLNIVFLSQAGEEQDERTGNRSSYSSAPYGTMAFYTFLSEQGRSVERFEQSFSELKDSPVQTLIVVAIRAELNPTLEEIKALEQWVAGGRHLIIVDRDIALELSSKTDMLSLRTTSLLGPSETVKPVQATALTRGVRSVAVTEYARAVGIAPDRGVAHFVSQEGALVADVEFGRGRITVLGEPYIIQNNGIRERDNLALALNLVEGLGPSGVIAFDEYHHGYGRAGSAERAGGLRGYIAGTPVPWMIGQLGLLGVAVALTLGRRFGRPIPLARLRRTSALEFVSSMANIQRLASASDLAIENIYLPFRLRLCRYAGLPSNSMTQDLAKAAADRGRIDRDVLLTIMRRCEDVLAGKQPPEPGELVTLVSDLRKLEAQLGL